MSIAQSTIVASSMPCVLLAGGCGVRANWLAVLLRSKGCEVVMSTGGEESWRRLGEQGFRAVIGEWSHGGRELLERVRDLGNTNGRGGYTYVIMVGSSSEEMYESLAEGVDDFLFWPVDVDLLQIRLEVAARIGRMQRDIAHKNSELRESNLRLEQANERMHFDLASAARVQQSLLPSPSFTAPGVDIGWRLRSCDELAGDILNCLRLDEHHLAFYVLDVSGHGVSSALLAVQVSRLMSPMMTQSELLKERLDNAPWYRLVEPRGVIQRLNELFQTTGEMTQYFTMIYGLLHVASGRVQLAAAGHPGPVLITASGESRILDCRSFPVGLFEEAEFYEHEFALNEGDRIWLYSDGVTDASDEHGNAFGEEQLRANLTLCQNLPAQDAVDSVIDVIERWVAPEEPDDDCTLLAIGRPPAPE